MIFVPLKRTADVDFGPAFNEHITTHYQEDPKTYSTQIAQLNKLRSDCGGAGRDKSGRDVWYRYYGQLELLDTRFPISESGVKIQFTWCDAFTSTQTSQYSVAFEKACTIFNIGATLSGIAAMQNRADEVGMKTAFNYFQSAAGLFQFISDNFLHAPSLDLSKDLQLAQAQECMVEKVVGEKKSGGLIAKIAAHAAFLFASALGKMSVGDLAMQFEKPWIEFVRTKMLYFQAISSLHRSSHLEAEQKYGDALSYMIQADEKTKESTKISAAFLKKYPTFSVTQSNQPATIAASLHEMTTFLLASTSESRKRMTRENEVIYHEQTTATPLEIEKTCVVKCQTFQDLFPTKEDSHRIIGSDIFLKLVPMSVHCSASIYSEDLNVLLKRTAEECDGADEMYSGLVASLEVAKVLSMMRGGDKSEFPADVLSMLDDVRASENNKTDGVDQMKADVERYKNEFRSIVDECNAIIEKDAAEDGSLRAQHGLQWTAPTSFSGTVEFRQDLRKFEDAFSQAQKADEGRNDDVMRDLHVLRQPVRRLEEIMNQRGDSVDLIDVNEGDVANEKALVKSIEDEMSKLRDIKAQRPGLLAELKAKSLILNQGKDQLVFQNELAKFAPLNTKIAQNIAKQSTQFQTLSSLLESIQKHSPLLQSIAARTKKWQAIFEKWRGIYEDYKEYRQNLGRGVKFYSNLSKMAENTRVHLTRYAGSAGNARGDLAKQLEGLKASADQQSMRRQLERLGVSSPRELAPQLTGGQYDRPAMLPGQLQSTHATSFQPQHSGYSLSNNFGPAQHQPNLLQFQQPPLQYQQSPQQYQQPPQQSQHFSQQSQHPTQQYQQPLQYQQAPAQQYQITSNAQYAQAPNYESPMALPPSNQQQGTQSTPQQSYPQHPAPNRNFMD